MEDWDSWPQRPPAVTPPPATALGLPLSAVLWECIGRGEPRVRQHQANRQWVQEVSHIQHLPEADRPNPGQLQGMLSFPKHPGASEDRPKASVPRGVPTMELSRRRAQVALGQVRRDTSWVMNKTPTPTHGERLLGTRLSRLLSKILDLGGLFRTLKCNPYGMGGETEVQRGEESHRRCCCPALAGRQPQVC